MVPQPSTPARRLPLDRRGRLRNGAAPGDFLAAPRCGACTRAGGCCRQPAMRNGRCRLHGGLSTGPRTAEGRARCAAARRKHGAYAAATRALLAEARARLRRVRGLAVRPTAGHGVLPSNSPMGTSAAPAGKIHHRAHRGHRDGVTKRAFTREARNHSSSVPSVSSVVNLSSAAGHGLLRSFLESRTAEPFIRVHPRASAAKPLPTAGHGVLPSIPAGTPPAALPARRPAPLPGLVRRTLLGSTALGLGLTVRPPVPAGHGLLPLISAGTPAGRPPSPPRRSRLLPGTGRLLESPP
jgi:hypothetical protein